MAVKKSAQAQKTADVVDLAPPNKDHNLAVFRQAALSQIKELTLQVSGSPQAVRAAWLKIGGLLQQARDSFVDTKSFGAWIVETEVALLPGLDTAPKRSDAIWCAEFSDRASVVPLSVDHPRKIRNWYRRAVAKRVEAEVQEILGGLAEGVEVVPPDVENAAEAMQLDLLLPTAEGMDLLLGEAKRWTSGEAGKTNWESGIDRLRAACKFAAAAGVSKDDALPSFGSIWGGFFAWSAKPAGAQVSLESASPEQLAAAMLAKTDAVHAIQLLTSSARLRGADGSWGHGPRSAQRCTDCGADFLRPTDEIWRTRCPVCFRRERGGVFGGIAVEAPHDRLEIDRLRGEVAALKWVNALLQSRLDEAEAAALFSRPAVAAPLAGFDEAEVRFLLGLAHPDRHQGSPIANAVTRKLIALRRRKPNAARTG